MEDTKRFSETDMDIEVRNACTEVLWVLGYPYNRQSYVDAAGNIVMTAENENCDTAKLTISKQ